MAPDLSDTKAAIDWAVAQLPDLAKQAIKWRHTRPYAVSIDANSDPGKKLYSIKITNPLDPIVSAAAGAILHSIRSSLDLLACALAARNGWQESKSTYFPIWKTKADFLDPKSDVLKKIKRLSQVDQDIIKNLRPYPRGNELLCSLHDLDLTRKHRRLLKTFVFPGGLRLIGFPDGGPIWIHELGGFDQETVLASTDRTVPDGDITVTLHVAFNETSAARRKDFTTSLREFASLATSVLGLF